MAREWTPDQKNAIEASGGSLLVSAAAGSGKTAVLVERVIRRICDSHNPCDADRLLIVTFTRAAAAEMKSRISEEINRRLRQNPGDANLIRQQFLLPNAKICTIDSFCSSLVRENFERLDISPDFTMIDDAQQTLLRKQVLDETLEEMYSNGGEGFALLASLLSGRNDDELFEAINKLYDNSRAHPFPEKWLDGICEQYESDKPFSRTYFGSLVLGYVADAAEYCMHILSRMKSIVSVDPELEAKFEKCISSDEAQVSALLEAAKGGDWDAAYRICMGFVFERKGSVPKAYKGSDIDDNLTDLRKTLKEKVIAKLPEIMCSNLGEVEDDRQFFLPCVRSLCEAVKRFSASFDELKREKNALDFADIELLALSLLVEEGENGEVRSTALANELSQSYEEILIDEYQDTNEAQDMLFTAISKPCGNLFRVGDVKQSIYRFRHAMPEIFIGIRNTCKDYDGESYPARINLGCNFRSRKGVTDAVNFVFTQIMSESAGEIDYDENERLVAAAQYSPASECETELHVLDLGDADEELSSTQHSARYVARLIEDMMKRGIKVRDKNGDRPLCYGDICVLMRTMKGKGTVFADEFRHRGIPSFTETPTDFFQATEISTMISLLRVIDNPRQDIPLLTVMLSPIYGFSPDDAVLLRTHSQGACLYARAVNLAKGGNAKYAALVDSLSRLRLISSTLCTDELIRRIYEETGYFAAVQAMPESAGRKSNLLLLLDYAGNYEAAGYIGLSGFIRFIDKLDSSKKTLDGTIAVSDSADVVRIMSIHKSKGLEFPVCILANCESQFNFTDSKGGMVVDALHGVGFRRRDPKTLAQYNTAYKSATQLSLKTSERAEQMRVLYVAMTRAKEKLILLNALKKPDLKLKQLAGQISPNSSRLTPFAVGLANSYSDWLLASFLRHADCGELRELAGVNNECVIYSDMRIKTVVARSCEDAEQTETTREEAAADVQLLSKLRESLDYEYQYSALAGLLTKRTASDFESGTIDRDYFASSRPAFLSVGGLTPAQKGTAVHRFMQMCDFEKARTDFESEKQRLVSLGLLSQIQADAVNQKVTDAFFSSELYDRISRSDKVFREKQFMIQLPLAELYEDLDDFADEKMLVQGVADCAFVENGKLVIADYKTDRTDNTEKLRSKYAGQLRVYARALSECTGLEVSQVLLWSFYLGHEIDMTDVI